MEWRIVSKNNKRETFIQVDMIFKERLLLFVNVVSSPQAGGYTP